MHLTLWIGTAGLGGLQWNFFTCSKIFCYQVIVSIDKCSWSWSTSNGCQNCIFNGSIASEIYVTQPEGYVDAERLNHVCKLRKSIYGRKKSVRCWYSTLDQHLISFGYHKSNDDGCIYITWSTNAAGQSSFVIFVVYVDDIISVSNDVGMLCKELKRLTRVKHTTFLECWLNR